MGIVGDEGNWVLGNELSVDPELKLVVTVDGTTYGDSLGVLRVAINYR